jgi:PAS domain S-box-containing protein
MENKFYHYIFEKINELLQVIGTKPIAEEELTPDVLIELDPLGIIAETFKTILENLNEKNLKLKLINDKLNILFNTINDGIYVINEDYELIMVNDNELNFFNMKREKLIGEKCYKVLAKNENICNGCKIPDVKKNNSPFILKHVNLSQLNMRKFCNRELVDIFFYPFEKGEYIIYIRDLSEINRNLKRIELEKEKLLVTLKSMAEGVILLDEKFKILLVNNSMENILETNSENLVNRSILDLLPNEIKEKFHLIYKDKKIITNYEFKLKLKELEKILEVSVSPIMSDNKLEGSVIICRDITEQKKMEQEIIKMEKLEAIGFLAGGIAHDFNNILTAALGNIGLCELFINNKEKLLKKLKLIESSIYRAKNLTSKLSTFSKGGAPVTEITDITNIIKDSMSFIVTGSSVKVEYNFQKKLWQANVDPTLIYQVIFNLTINSLQSMKNKGEIQIKVENFELDGKKYIKIIFKDNGCGIHPEILPKIFDPFFTTDTSRSGLGLAIVYNIIKNHGGKISVKSKIGKSTEFKILLPAADMDTQKSPSDTKNKNNNKVMGKNILIMDDEKSLRDAVKEILEMKGYKVFTSKNGEQAIEIYKKEKIDLVILDLTVVDGMGGEETIKKLKEIDPKVKAIVSSGYSNIPILTDFKKYGFFARLEKPFLLKELIEVIEPIV